MKLLRRCRIRKSLGWVRCRLLRRPRHVNKINPQITQITQIRKNIKRESERAHADEAANRQGSENLCDHRCGDGGSQAPWLWFSRSSLSKSPGDRILKTRHIVQKRGPPSDSLQRST